MAGAPLVSIIVINYNGKQFLEACFDSLANTHYQAVDLYLVDNASSDGSIPFMRENYPDVTLIETGGNLGYAGAYNYALSKVDGPYAVLLNNDVEVSAGWLDPLVAEMEADANIAACQPKIRHLVDREKFDYAGASGGFIDRYGYPFLRGRILTTIEKDDGQYDDAKDIFWVSGAALMVRVTDFHAVGGLDADFFLHMEEIDFCWRLHLAGRRLRVVPGGTIYHYAGGTLGGDSFRKMYWNHRNSIFMLLKNYSATSLVKVLPLRLLFDGLVMVKSLLSLDFKRLAAVPLAYLWLLAHMVMILRKRKVVQAARIEPDSALRDLMLPGSLIISYYLRGRKTFAQIWRR